MDDVARHPLASQGRRRDSSRKAATQRPLPRGRGAHAARLFTGIAVVHARTHLGGGLRSGHVARAPARRATGARTPPRATRSGMHDRVVELTIPDQG